MESSYFNASPAVNESEKDNNKKKMSASDIHLVHVLVRMKDTKGVRLQTDLVNAQFSGSLMSVFTMVHG